MSLGLAWGLAANDRFLFALSLDAIVGGRYHRTGTVCLFPSGCGESSSEGRDMVFILTPIVRFHPLATSGLFVRAGMGAGFSGMGNPNTLFGFGPEPGLGTTLGVGWDVRLGESNVAATPVVNAVWIRASDQTSSSVQVGVGLTFH